MQTNKGMEAKDIPYFSSPESTPVMNSKPVVVKTTETEGDEFQMDTICIPYNDNEELEDQQEEPNG